MTCLDFENRLHECCDQRQRELPRELASHLARCDACRQSWESFQRLHDAIATWRTPIVHPGFAELVLRRWQEEQSAIGDSARIVVPSRSAAGPRRLTRCESSLLSWLAMLTSALALLVVASIGWRVSGNASFAVRQHRSWNSVATTLAPSVTVAADRQLDVLLHDARDAYAALASQAWQHVSTANVLLPSGETVTPLSTEAAPQGLPEPLVRPLTPLGRDLRDAVDVLLQQVFTNQDSST